VLLHMTCSYEYVLGSDIYLNAVFNQMYNNIISYSRCYQFNSCVCVCVCVFSYGYVCEHWVNPHYPGRKTRGNGSVLDFVD